MELPGRRELREQILHQMDGRTSYVSDADVYDKDHGLEIREDLFHVEKLKDYGQYEKYCEAVKLFREGRAEQKKEKA